MLLSTSRSRGVVGLALSERLPPRLASRLAPRTPPRATIAKRIPVHADETSGPTSPVTTPETQTQTVDVEPIILSSAPKPASAAEMDSEPEVTFLETRGANAELVVSLLFGLSLIYAPLTIASLGKRAWFKTTFTNKRIIVENSSPLFKNTVQVWYSQIKEVRTLYVAFGLWGNMVVFLKDGSRLELTGLPQVAETRAYIEERILELEAKQRDRKVDSLSA